MTLPKERDKQMWFILGFWNGEGVILDYPDGPSVITRVHTGRRRRKIWVEREGNAKTEADIRGAAVSQRMSATSKNWKSQGQVLSWRLRRNRHCQHLDSSPVKTCFELLASRTVTIYLHCFKPLCMCYLPQQRQGHECKRKHAESHPVHG